MRNNDFETLSDGELVACFRTGRDEDAFAELVHRHGPMVMRVAVNVVGDRHDAEDAFQATFLAFAAASARLSRRTPIAAWLYGATVRTSKSLLRANAKWTRKMERGREMAKQEYDSDAERNLDARAVHDELSRIPAAYRAAVLLCDLQELSRKEAARRLGVSVPTVCKQVARGRQLLRSRLARRGLGAAFGGTVVFPHSASAQIAPAMVETTTKRALLFLAGKRSAEIGVSEAVLNTAKEAMKAMTIAKLTNLAAVVAAACLLAVSTGGIVQLIPQAQGGAIVVPSGLENVDGNLALPIGGNSGRIQFLFPAADFMSLPQSHRTITGFAWRPDASYALTEPIFGPARFRLSTTDADSLDPVFANNIGEDEALVFDGMLNWQPTDSGPGPRDFAFRVTFDKPFHYDAGDGKNLILDFIPPAEWNRLGWPMDAQTTSAATWVDTDDPLAAEAYASRQWIMVTQFTFVPEPSTGTSAVAVLACVCLCAARRSLSTIRAK